MSWVRVASVLSVASLGGCWTHNDQYEAVDEELAEDTRSESSDESKTEEPGSSEEETGSSEEGLDSSEDEEGLDTGGSESGEMCDPEESYCFGACINTQIDFMNCGGCDQPCNNNEFCELGQCEPEEFMRRVFVTSSPFLTDFLVDGGADARCQEAALEAEIVGDYKAWIGSDGVGPEDTFSKPGSFVVYISDDEYKLVASDWASLVTGLEHAIDRDEYTNEAEPNMEMMDMEDCGYGWAVWTAADASGSAAVNDCEFWTNTYFDHSAQVGRFDKANEEWTHLDCEVACDAELPIYCFQQ